MSTIVSPGSSGSAVRNEARHQAASGPTPSNFVDGGRR
jgi:hypothetical protein